MKANALVVQGALALAALGAAYVTWQRPKETVGDATVTVLDATKAKLERVRYEDARAAIELSKAKEKDRYLLTQQTFVVKPPPAPLALDGGSADAGITVVQAPEEKPKPPRTVLAGERADKLFERFAPFEAVRALGKLPQEKRQEVGLEGAERKLTLTVGGTPKVYRVSRPDTGSVGTYLLDEASGDVFLLSGTVFAELEPSSQALVERRLHAFKAAEVDELEVSADGKQKAFVQKDAEIPQTTKIAPKSAPDKPDELVKNWHDKVWSRLIVTEVFGEGELPAKGEPKVQARVDYRSRGKPKGFIELGTVDKELFARSENTVGWVALHAGSDELVTEAKKIASAP